MKYEVIFLVALVVFVLSFFALLVFSARVKKFKKGLEKINYSLKDKTGKNNFETRENPFAEPNFQNIEEPVSELTNIYIDDKRGLKDYEEIIRERQDEIKRDNNYNTTIDDILGDDE